MACLYLNINKLDLKNNRLCDFNIAHCSQRSELATLLVAHEETPDRSETLSQLHILTEHLKTTEEKIQ